MFGAGNSDPFGGERRWLEHDDSVKLKWMKFTVSIYQDEDGMFIAECPSIPGCVSQGKTETEAEGNIADAIRECLAARAKLGMQTTVTTREVAVAV